MAEFQFFQNHFDDFPCDPAACLLAAEFFDERGDPEQAKPYRVLGETAGGIQYLASLCGAFVSVIGALTPAARAFSEYARELMRWPIVRAQLANDARDR